MSASDAEDPNSHQDADLARERTELQASRPQWWESAAIQLVPWVGTFAAEYQKSKWQEAADALAIQANQRAFERVSDTLEELRSRIELQPMEIIERLQEERVATLLNEAMLIASRSGLRAKRLALARVLSNVISNEEDAAIDEAEMLVKALSQLENAHVRVIGLLYEVPPFNSKRLSLTSIRLNHPELNSTVEGILLQLSGWGLVKRVKPQRLPGRGGLPERYVSPSSFNREDDFMLSDLGIRMCSFLLSDTGSLELPEGQQAGNSDS